MDAVRGVMPDKGSRANGGTAAAGPTGWRAPQWRQNGCSAPTGLPHWLQKGIYLSLRYASAICSGNIPPVKATRPC
jgi:hypothetical protein